MLNKNIFTLRNDRRSESSKHSHFVILTAKLKRLCQEEKYSKSNRLERRYFQFSILDDLKR